MILSGGTLYLGQPDGSWAELGSITSAELTFEPAADEPPAPFEGFSTTRSLSLSFRTPKLSAHLYRLLFNHRHPRLRSMHCAYSRRLRARRRRAR